MPDRSHVSGVATRRAFGPSGMRLRLPRASASSLGRSLGGARECSSSLPPLLLASISRSSSQSRHSPHPGRPPFARLAPRARCSSAMRVSSDQPVAVGELNDRPDFARCAESGGPSMGFGALRRFRKQAATYAGLASPGFAASSGFLDLLTLPSACNLSGLVSCR
jgi:hypothetical protein